MRCRWVGAADEQGSPLPHLLPSVPARPGPDPPAPRWYDSQVLHCNKNPIYVFLFWELCGLSPNFHFHVSVIDLYIPRIGLHISSSRIGTPIVGIYKSLTDGWMWKLGLRPRYSFSGNLFRNFGVLSLQCRTMRGKSTMTNTYHIELNIYFKNLYQAVS